jgi:hypothetical protein
VAEAVVLTPVRFAHSRCKGKKGAKRVKILNSIIKTHDLFVGVQIVFVGFFDFQPQRP